MERFLEAWLAKRKRSSRRGFELPIVKIFSRGKLNNDLWQTILTNCRRPEERAGDFQSMLGTCRTSEIRLNELYERYGSSAVGDCIELILDRSDRIVRKAVAELPDGDFYYEEYLENNGMVPGPVPMRCKLTISGENLTFDFAGSAPQVEGPTNAGPAMGYAGIFNMVKSFLSPVHQ